MEGKGKLHCWILTIAQIIHTIFIIAGCTEKDAGLCAVSIVMDTGSFMTKSVDPNETKVTDISLIIFDEYGRAEATLWINGDQSEAYRIYLTAGKKYRFVACVNFGYRINLSNASELQSVKYHMAYPDEYRNGIPMFADTGYIRIHRDSEVKLKLIRLMSKISIRLDRSRLSKDVEMCVTGIRIGNCPKQTSVFTENSVKNADECFTAGFSKTEQECYALNQMEGLGLSYPVSLYMLENIQGNFSDSIISSDSEKVFDTYDPRRDRCSYIEIDIDYVSSKVVSSGNCLKYRFYLGKDLNDLNVERNCHYQLTISPEDDGLKDNGWRVDKDGLISNEPISFSYYPDSYIKGNIGEQIHVGCCFTPSDTPFDVGLEYMENDRRTGIYDYVVDDDGHGATLILTGAGSGLIYMSAGPPVNQSALWFIEVNLPQNASQAE